tara:strand:- start:294 stop:395 length:102 start_codon:yes stop_codon:yes gene_type:complete
MLSMKTKEFFDWSLNFPVFESYQLAKIIFLSIL